MNDIDELDRLHAAATAGEWVLRPYQEPSGEWAPAPSWETYGEDNLTLTAALKNAWPSVSARLRAAEAEVERLRGVLRNVRDNYDCDEDAHRYGTICRRCDARAALGEP